MAQAIKITHLPYMGPRSDDVLAHAPFPTVEREVEEARYEATKSHDFDDPYVVLTRKVAALATMLHCDEAEAENILFSRIGRVMQAKREPLTLLKS